MVSATIRSYERDNTGLMILLSAITSTGTHLALKTASGIVVLEHAGGQEAGLPTTLEQAVLDPGAMAAVRQFVHDQPTLTSHAVQEAEIELDLLFRPRNV